MEQKFFGSAMCRGLPIRYYLLQQQGIEGKHYGIRVEYNGEAVTASDLSLSERRVRQLLGKLVQGCATPISLPDILEDWLLE